MALRLSQVWRRKDDASSCKTTTFRRETFTAGLVAVPQHRPEPAPTRFEHDFAIYIFASAEALMWPLKIAPSSSTSAVERLCTLAFPGILLFFARSG
ncbi:hypothetical protein ACFFYR_01610 [Paraburkholderia dipogonis]|uniref:hypothetical protein n=1 Tax=Paraburkholderia dipogonis TaxID=1211383 RepID=UPI0035E6303E